MAWLSGITGKAEDFLIRLDQSAAGALKSESKAVQQQQIPSIEHQEVSWEIPTYMPTLSPSHSVPANLNEFKNSLDPASSLVSSPVKQASKFSGTNSQSPTKSVKKLNSDDALFEFLNSSESLEGNKKKISGFSPSTKHSRQSSASSTVSNKVCEQTVEHSFHGSSTMDSDNEMVRSSSISSSSAANEGSLSEGSDLHPQESTLVELENRNKDHDSKVHQSSALELENNLLKTEVASLNQEMVSLIQRAKDAEEGLNHIKKKLNEFNHSSSHYTRTIQELQSRESDLMETLTAKDSQLAVLRVRLEEADQEIQRKNKLIESHQGEKERILKDHTDSSGIHNQALETLKVKLSEVEDTLKREQAAFQKIQYEARERETKLEAEQRSLAETLTATQRKLEEDKGKVFSLNNQVKTLKINMEASKQELVDYKDKAARILQSKERLIASLREGSGAAGDLVSMSNLEYDAVKQERDIFKDELQQNKALTENLKSELQELEMQYHQESEMLQDQVSSLSEQLEEEKQKLKDTEHDLLRQKNELQFAIEEMQKLKMGFQTKSNQKEAEIEKLRNQLMTKNLSSTTENELESRVRTLTESLIQKQTVLEAISTEKNSLVLQLERLEQQYKDVQMSAVRTNTAVSINDEEDVRQRLPVFMKEKATDTEVTRRMKRAANTIDRFSIRLGVFLRRYPIARVFVIVYMVLLHMWVMIVLLTYQPEVHGMDYQPKAPKDKTE